MPTAYVFFGRAITSDTATALLQATRVLLSETKTLNVPPAVQQAMQQQAGAQVAPPAQVPVPSWDTLKISFASGGGDVIAAFAIYNELKALPLTLHTHNAGAVDSAAIIPFMLGERRTAAAASAFFFHQLQWTFAAKDNLTATVIGDATKWLSMYEDINAGLVAARTGLAKEAVLKMMREGTTVSPVQARELGLIHEIEEHALPRNCRTWQVSKARRRCPGIVGCTQTRPCQHSPMVAIKAQNAS